MDQPVKFREIERKVFHSFHEDGLIDLFLSFIMIVSIVSSTLSAIGMNDAVRISIYVPLMVIVGPVFYMLGKKYITFPRIGYVKLAGKSTKYRLMVFIILTAILATLLLMTIINASNEGHNSVLGIKEEIWSSVFMTLIIIGIFSLLAALTGVVRFLLLGVFVAVSEPLYMIFDFYTASENPGLYAYGIPAMLLLVSGITMLLRFLRKYPLNNKAMSSHELS